MATVKAEEWQAGGDAVVQAIKDEFDATYGASWHVVVGKHFGSKVTHDAKHFAFFYLDVSAVGGGGGGGRPPVGGEN
jgi:hypothetical protein